MISMPPAPSLPAAVWQQRAALHLQKAEGYTAATRKRRDRDERNPVEDFLFEYYPYPIALLEKWHPGVGLTLEWDSATLPPPFSPLCYSLKDGALFADTSLIPLRERERLQWIAELLVATRGRLPNFACHGLHEWAMVYGGKNVRHEKTTPLRLPQAEIDALVEARPICCSHHDAFRFFAPAARPLNRLQPSLTSRVTSEQPGCVHANMDLYKWAAKAMPWIGTDVLLECFELAHALRDLDMRASPYDLTAWGKSPICIETPDGRRIYEVEQRRLASRAAPLREKLIEGLNKILA
jgi:hypothetical protein